MAQNDKPQYADPVGAAAGFARELEGLAVSVDVSTGDGPDWGARVYGRIYSAQEDDGSVILLAEAIEDTRQADPLRVLAEWLTSKDWMLPALQQIEGAPSEVLAEAITRAKVALGRTQEGT